LLSHFPGQIFLKLPNLIFRQPYLSFLDFLKKRKLKQHKEKGEGEGEGEENEEENEKKKEKTKVKLNDE